MECHAFFEGKTGNLLQTPTYYKWWLKLFNELRHCGYFYFISKRGTTMRRIMIALLFILLATSACQADPENAPNNQNENNNNNNEVVEEPNNENNTINNNETTNNEANNQNDENHTNNATNNETNENNETPDDEKTIEELLSEETYNFFIAQREKDIETMNSYLATTATYDEKADNFYFDDITYPHEMERFEIKDEDLEYRYTQEEADYVIIGYASVNYEEEYSFVIDFMWVQEDGQWKIKDMEMNK